MRKVDETRCTGRFPGPDKGPRCYFDKMGRGEVCAGHEQGDTFNVAAHNAYEAERRERKKRRKPRKVVRRQPRRVHREA